MQTHSMRHALFVWNRYAAQRTEHYAYTSLAFYHFCIKLLTYFWSEVVFAYVIPPVIFVFSLNKMLLVRFLCEEGINTGNIHKNAFKTL